MPGFTLKPPSRSKHTRDFAGSSLEVDQLDSRSLVLVDHNRMTDPVAAHFEARRVRQVLDHHAGAQMMAGVSAPELVVSGSFLLGNHGMWVDYA